MLAVAMLMTDYGFDAAIRQQFPDQESLARGQGHRLFKSNQARAALDAGANHLAAEVRESAEAEDIGLGSGSDLERVRALGRAEFGRGRVQTGWVNVAHANHLEAVVRLKSLGMVHSALAHAHDHDTVFGARSDCTHRALLSHSNTLSTV